MVSRIWYTSTGRTLGTVLELINCCSVDSVPSFLDCLIVLSSVIRVDGILYHMDEIIYHSKAPTGCMTSFRMFNIELSRFIGLRWYIFPAGCRKERTWDTDDKEMTSGYGPLFYSSGMTIWSLWSLLFNIRGLDLILGVVLKDCATV
ncbi:hypothetical protein NPIL_341831 [Nephila pilipes]|uniref:Uncharacterized protein n=1 Tax=Nephila pilipes TaxID=299642 RepID=A0A8X6PW98_NEPPI|nr:hypothetical protein NPIL_341831 [Nephila pilipes]